MSDSPAPKGERLASVAALGTTSSSPAVVTGLGDDVDRLVAKSPSLQKDVRKLKEDGWVIEYGPEGGGSYADRTASPPAITIDGSEKGYPEVATQSLAHEVGHAAYPYAADYSSRIAFVNGALADEGAATINNIKVQREILSSGGPDIGIAGNGANHAAYNAACDQYVADGNAIAARNAIGAKFGTGEITSNTAQSYADYYGGWYDQVCPATK